MTDGVPGLLSIIGGKLTTYRKMAEDVVDRVVRLSQASQPCRTASTPLPSDERVYYALGRRPARLHDSPQPGRSVACECEIVLLQDVENALRQSGSPDLDDLRRDLRLGMGPCQGAFCAYRAAAAAAIILPDSPDDGGLAAFVEERWRGLRPLAWGRGLRQAEFLRRVQIELLGTEAATAGDE